ncbi:Small ubiquitin- modifier 1 [Aduncisulcus paluster]|uniref:Small ubiquitin- modifier 1 n=1 Tax=Aduncisulcus paluster TaxID=2918883 RepID=A0ABQ5JVB1_9EUKA|nr:Small ubiquitin- modifier 1 [Aduncisulcus paluster]
MSEARPEKIHLILRNSEGQSSHFRISPQAPFQKLFNAYCQRSGVPHDSVRFIFDGERIDETRTAQDLHLKDQDVISVVTYQYGGF